MLPQYRQNIAAAVCGWEKVIVRSGGSDLYDLQRDPEEMRPQACDLEAIARRWPAAAQDALMRLRDWQPGSGA